MCSFTMVVYIGLYGFPEFDDINMPMLVHVYIDPYDFPDFDDIMKKSVNGCSSIR